MDRQNQHLTECNAVPCCRSMQFGPMLPTHCMEERRRAGATASHAVRLQQFQLQQFHAPLAAELNCLANFRISEFSSGEFLNFFARISEFSGEFLNFCGPPTSLYITSNGIHIGHLLVTDGMLVERYETLIIPMIFT